MGLPTSQSKLRPVGPGVPELWSDKQTDEERLQLIYIDCFAQFIQMAFSIHNGSFESISDLKCLFSTMVQL